MHVWLLFSVNEDVCLQMFEDCDDFVHVYVLFSTNEDVMFVDA